MQSSIGKKPKNTKAETRLAISSGESLAVKRRLAIISCKVTVISKRRGGKKNKERNIRGTFVVYCFILFF